ncbi:hypothetical protein GOP47_0002907 [Adiantum capillus-veneris]|uniref:Exportin-T n=1 Tax=Adiantum capillus-veneris TaxID=13818 RepID=A0A9D4VBR9_ADICA|nr:hypothetical protein GOP47_0002907 [Adiantum capillus-veneris]
MDDFEKAIIISFDQSGGVDAQLRAQAMAFCQSVKQSPNILQLCLDKLRVTQFAEVQFWCLQTIEELVKVRYRLLDVQERRFLQSTLMGLLCTYGLEEDATQNAIHKLSRPIFVKNKLSQIIVILICIDYPSGWPSVFLDLIGFLPKGHGVVDMFCRVMNTLDEEVISLDYSRKPEEVLVATRIKDAMRQQCVTQIVGSCYNLALAYKGVRPQLAGMVLDMLQRCVAWIDIQLVANDTFIPLLFDLLLSSQESTEVRGAAADCLLAIVSKKMDASLKLNLLRQLQIGRICGSFAEKQETDLMLKLSNLFTGFATEVLCCHKKLLGAESTDQVAASIEDLLDAVVPSIFYFLHSDDEDISSTTLQFLSNYVSGMKSKLSEEKQSSHLTQMLDAILNKMRYDPADKDSLNVPDKAGKEEEERMSDYRKDLLGLFRSIHRIAPTITKGFIKSTLSRVFGDPDVSFEDAEATIMLLYVLGEGLSEESFKSGSDVAELVTLFFSGQISCHSHRLVALLYLECVTRASYLFMRFVKMLRLQLLPYVEIVLQSLQDILAGFTSSKVQLRKSQTMSFEDGSHAFEAIGLLLGVEELSEEKQMKYLSALLVPLCNQVDSLLTCRPLDDDPALPSTTVVALQQVIVAINSLSKGFGEQLATCTRPAVGMLFKQALDVLLRVLQVFPKNKILRGKVISFLHRMIETLGSSMFPFLPTAFQQLLVESEPKEMLEFLVLINQLISTFKSGIKDLIQELFPYILGHVFTTLPNETYPEGPESHTEEMQNLQELERVYFTFLQGITSNELSSILLSSKNSHLLNDVIQSVLVASCQHKDVLVRKVCVQIFTRLVKDWCGTRVEEEKVPGFRGFIVETFAAKCCVYSVLEPSFNLRDANTFNLFGEIVAAQKVIYDYCGNEFLIHQATQVLPAVHCPPNMAEQYCFHIQRSDMKDFKSFYKSFVEKLKPQQNGSVPRRGFLPKGVNLQIVKKRSWKPLIAIAV